MHRLLAWAMVLPAIAGCITDSTPVETPDNPALLTWVGATLEAPPSDAFNNPPPFMERPPRPVCDGPNCETIPFTIPANPDSKDVVIAIEWEGQDDSYPVTSMPGGYLGSANIALDAVVKSGGKVVADGHESFHYASVVVLENPSPGDYEVEVVARWGTGSYLGSIRFQEPGTLGTHPGLPDLVMLPPDHINFQAPLLHEANDVLRLAAEGCGPDETAEDQELRCLRFAGILGNQGPGDFELNLYYDDAADSIPGSGHWQQRIFEEGGASRLVPAGEAEYHEVHGHFHILDFVETTLYEYDEETDTRGADTGFGRKTGFCIIDGGLIDPTGDAVVPKYHGVGCCYLAGICQMDMLNDDHFMMGMSPGWYDIYPWWRADQYVEVSGLPDGVYELVSVINPDEILEETRMDNNVAGTIFRITGSEVEMIRQWTQANVGPHPDADWGYQAE